MPKVESSTPPSQPEPASRAELNEYVRTNLIRAAVMLVLLFGALGVAGKLYEDELVALTEQVYETVGVIGLLAALLVTDAIISPLPPDVILIVIAKSDLQHAWQWLVPVTGVVSAAAGNLGWFVGYRFAKFPLANRWIQGLRDKHAKRVQRYGRWAIALGAITPLPFSVTCITSGALGMPWRQMAPMTLLRIPRFLVMYGVIITSVMW